MHEMTKENVKNAFAGESQAFMKYTIFADIAQKEGRKNIARLFRAIAYAEKVHASNHLRELGGISSTKENLEEALEGEMFEIEEMYPVYHNTAQFQGEKGAERSTYYALEAEKIHANMYKNAVKSVEHDKDVTVGTVSVCSICGYTTDSDVPDFCPVCGAEAVAFKQF